jgi:predicted transcriptional regulator
MIERCRRADLPEPEIRLEPGFFILTIRRKTPQVTPEVIPQVGTKSGPGRDQVEIIRKCLSPRAIGDLMLVSGRSNRTKFRDQVLKPLMEAGWIEMTIPDKPTSRLQKYRLTDKGRALLKELGK